MTYDEKRKQAVSRELQELASLLQRSGELLREIEQTNTDVMACFRRLNKIAQESDRLDDALADLDILMARWRSKPTNILPFPPNQEKT